MNKGRILAIDDENFFRKLYEGILISEGFFVRTVAGGKEALSLLKEESYDIVIADMVMPGWDGIRTVGEIKKVNPDQDIIMVTHVSDVETVIEAMKSGAADYILKPVKKEAILQSVRKLLKRQKIILEHAKLVKESIEHFEILSTYKKCLDILSINDYRRLVDSIVDAMVTESGARTGLFWISDKEGESWKTAGTISQNLLEKACLPADDELWAGNMKSGLPFCWPEKSGNKFYAPILLQRSRAAVVELADKKAGRHFDEKDLKSVGVLAEFSQVALTNAKKISSLEGHSFKDEESGLYTYSFFEDSLRRQIFIASRYSRPFSIVYLKIHNYVNLIESFGREVVRSSVRKIINKVEGVIRDSDIMAVRGEEEFCILLTETDYFGSIMAMKRIEDGIAGIKYVSDGESSMPVNMLVMSASYPRDGSDIKGLMEAVTKRTEEVKESLFQHLELSDKGFWESVDIILEDSEGYKRLGSTLPSEVYSEFSDRFYAGLRDMFAREVSCRPYLRGVLFVGTETISPRDDFCSRIAGLENLSTRVFVVGKKGNEEWNVPNITPVYLKEGEIPVNMVFFLNEETGYAFLRKPDKGEGSLSFHTSDVFLVEKLISKLRDHYLLQWI